METINWYGYWVTFVWALAFTGMVPLAMFAPMVVSVPVGTTILFVAWAITIAIAWAEVEYG